MDEHVAEQRIARLEQLVAMLYWEASTVASLGEFAFLDSNRTKRRKLMDRAVAELFASQGVLL